MWISNQLSESWHSLSDARLNSLQQAPLKPTPFQFPVKQLSTLNQTMHSWICVKHYRIKRSHRVSGRLSKSRTYFPEITVIFTSIKRSPLPIGRGRPWSETALLYFFFYLCWATYSKNIQIKLGIISQGKLNPCFSPEIKVSSIIEWVFVHYKVNNGRRLFIVSRSQVMGSCRFSFYSFSLRPIFSVKPVLSGRHCSWVIA